MNFTKTSTRLKPIIDGKIGNKEARMLIDTGADYIVLNVPKYKMVLDDNGKPKKDKYGRYEREKIYLDAEYDKIIRENYGSFIPDKFGNIAKTTVHGFGDTFVICRLLILNSFTVDNHEFTNSFVLLDEFGFANNQDIILGTSCLRNFILTIDMEERSIDFTPKEKELKINLSNIFPANVNVIDDIISFPSDIYMQDYFE